MSVARPTALGCATDSSGWLRRVARGSLAQAEACARKTQAG
eukprot:COSAG04_NODE_11789_length_688_cov_1.482173_1_plen_40_part_10